MASWCSICGKKLDKTYLHWKGKKVHKSCYNQKLKDKKNERH